MLRRALLSVPLAVALSFAAMPAGAADRGSKDEAVAMVNAAFDHIKKAGLETAAADFTTDKAHWANKDLYVFVFDADGVFLSHGANAKLVGRNMANMKDANGKAIFPAMKDVAAKGTGWVDYDWAHPQSKKVEGKSTYVRATPDGKGLIGVGIYR